jgi:NAD(P)-dependent dehydrogenase (short-subunit alcohol dehydrogenase family)
LAEAAAEISANGRVAQVARVDVTDAESVRWLLQGTAAELGRVDYFFNNAGISIPGEIRDLSLAQWRRVIEVNLFGEIHGIHYAYPLMIRQGFGHIVNSASGLGMAPWPLTSPNVASKFAIYGISHALAAEARAFGIDVSIICPGFIDTPMVRRMEPVNAHPDDVAALRRIRPMSVSRAAQIVLAGVARKKFLITFPAYVRFGALLHRSLPRVFMHVAQRQVEQFRKIRRAPDFPLI